MWLFRLSFFKIKLNWIRVYLNLKKYYKKNSNNLLIYDYVIKFIILMFVFKKLEFLFYFFNKDIWFNILNLLTNHKLQEGWEIREYKEFQWSRSGLAAATPPSPTKQP